MPIDPDAKSDLRNVNVSPFPGYDVAGVTNTGGIIVDAGDTWYLGLKIVSGAQAGRCLIAKYVYATNTLSELAILSDTNQAVPQLCWNPSRTKIIAFYPEGSDTRFFQVGVGTTQDVIDLGLIAGVQITDMAPDVTDYIGKNLLSKTFYRLDPVELTAAVLLVLPNFCGPFELTTDYIYTASATDVPGFGPVCRLARSKSYLMEFLFGSTDGAQAVSGSANPAYPSFAGRANRVLVRGDRVFVAQRTADSSGYLLLQYRFTTGGTKTLQGVGSPSFWYFINNLSTMACTDDGSKLAILLNSSGLYFYG